MSPQKNAVLLLTKRVMLFAALGVASIFVIKAIYAFAPAEAKPVGQERKVKVRDFQGMPVALVEVRNLQSETWYEDLEIELKNVSGKPIYFLSAYLEFPDDSVGGTIYGIHLSWGEPKRLDSRKYADPDAAHVQTGKTFVLTIPEMYKKGLRAMHRMRPQVTKNLRLWFEKTYFGDGTGFESEGKWQDFRGPAPPAKPDKKHHSSRLNNNDLNSFVNLHLGTNLRWR